MNIELLKKVRDYIVENPEKLKMSIEYDRVSGCGCIVGHAMNLTDNLDYGFWLFCSHILELSTFQMEFLIYPIYWWSGEAKDNYFEAEKQGNALGMALSTAYYIDEFIEHFSKPENMNK